MTHTINADGSLANAKRRKQRAAARTRWHFWMQILRRWRQLEMSLKADAFDGDEEEDYYDDDKVTSQRQLYFK